MRKKDTRTYDRDHYEEPIIFSKYGARKYQASRMYNSSLGGMCFITNSSIPPGSDLCIKIENFSPTYFSHEISDGYRGEVKWCHECTDVYASYYGKFVVVGSARSGSNLIMSYLNSHSQICCYYEIFHPEEFESHKNHYYPTNRRLRKLFINHPARFLKKKFFSALGLAHM